MSNSVTTKQNSMFSGLGSGIGFSAVLSGGFGSLSALRSHGKNALEATKKNNAVLNDFRQNISGDRFTKNLKTAYNYEEFTKLAKKQAKLERKVANLTKKSKAIPEKLSEALKTATTDLDKAKDSLKSGEAIVDTLKTATTVKGALKSTLKKELKDPFGFIVAISDFGMRLSSDIIPAFKEKGTKEGIKETFKSLVASTTTWAADIGLSAVFRTVGATVGMTLGPVGAAIGSTIGNIVGGILSSNIVQKVFPIKSFEQSTTEETPEATQVAQETSINAEQTQDLNTKYANVLSPDEAKRLAHQELLARNNQAAQNMQQKSFYA